jgi:uncharacterized RDD family membrane protein YckC
MDESNPYAPPQAAVQDVADPSAWIEPAERGTRLGAAILDSLIIGVGVYLPAMIGFAVIASSGGGEEAGLAAALLLGLVGFSIWGWYTYRFVSENGQSIAKRLLGIKVIRRDGSPASVGRIFWLRNVVNGLIGIVPLYGIVDILFIFGESRECLHDKIADTMVVKA